MPGSRPPFDPEVAIALASREDIVTMLAPEQIQSLRARSEQPDVLALTRDGEATHTVHRIPRRDGGRIDLALIRPAASTRPVPLLFHVHGGGLVTGTAYDALAPVARIAATAGMAVSSVEYRLAPENPYPAAIDDVHDALVWIAAEAPDLGIDANRIVVEGVSAGGGLAAAAVLRSRDEGPDLYGQMLICPMLDHRNASGSAHQMAGHGAWDRSANETAWTAYLGGAPEHVPPTASPSRADDLSGVPRTFIDVGSAETFRDECVEYAARIWADGGDAELHVWPGGAHGFDVLVPDAALSRDAVAARVDWLRRVLTQSEAAS
ncbi:alpha/beta hydrolase [Microbacterium halotolerans]|uniref:alpha/beta hydrolase n=1 Tax=Microbacterium halotolerans TaxID=246613 RepID=UPI000E6ACFD8|nr:alpha/beta hydrolase [Microbacterium halotolerans]